MKTLKSAKRGVEEKDQSSLPSTAERIEETQRLCDSYKCNNVDLQYTDAEFQNLTTFKEFHGLYSARIRAGNPNVPAAHRILLERAKYREFETLQTARQEASRAEDSDEDSDEYSNKDRDEASTAAENLDENSDENSSDDQDGAPTAAKKPRCRRSNFVRFVAETNSFFVAPKSKDLVKLYCNHHGNGNLGIDQFPGWQQKEHPMTSKEIEILLEQEDARTSYPIIFKEYPHKSIKQLATLLGNAWEKNYPEILGISRQVINKDPRAGAGIGGGQSLSSECSDIHLTFV